VKSNVGRKVIKGTKGIRFIFDTMLHLPHNILLIRQVLDETQPVFGARFGATKPMIVSYEKGKANPDELFLDRLSRLTGVPLEDLQNKKLKEGDLKLEKVETAVSGQAGDTLRILSESNLKLADANQKLADSHVKLVDRLIGNDLPESVQDDSATLKDLLEVLADVGVAAKKWHSKEEGLAALHRISVEYLKRKQVVDTRSGSGTKNRAKA
jgi:transcriptional regulator with XRE-family HTH domain